MCIIFRLIFVILQVKRYNFLHFLAKLIADTIDHTESSTVFISTMSIITIQCRLVAQESTMRQIWDLMTQKNTPFVNELLEKVHNHPEFLNWVETGNLPPNFIAEQSQLLKLDPRFSQQPARFYSSATTLVKNIYKSWIAIQSKLKQRIKNKKLWLEEILKSDEELEREYNLTLSEIYTQAQTILTEAKLTIQKAQATNAQLKDSSIGKQTKKSKKGNNSNKKFKTNSIFNHLFEQYKQQTKPLFRAAIIHLLKNNYQITDQKEEPEKLVHRQQKKVIEIKRLQQQLESRVPKSRDLTGWQWLETIETVTNTIPENEIESSLWQAQILQRSSTLPFPVSYETNEDLTWFKNEKGKICVWFNGLKNLVYEIRCDRRQLHWFERFVADRETKRQSKNQHSASLFTLRSCKIAWQKGKGKGQPWNIHHLKLYCSLETRLWTAEGTEQIAQEKAAAIEKILEKQQEKTDLTSNQKAYIQRQKSTLERINTPFPRPNQSLYQGQSSIIVGVSLGLDKLATVAVVDVLQEKVLTYCSIKKLLGKNYHLLSKMRRQQQRDSKKRHKAQKQAGNNQFGTSNLGEHIDRLLAKEIVQIAKRYSVGTIALPQLKNMRDIIHSEVQARAERKIPGCIEAQKQYAQQYRISIHQWSYNRLTENIIQQAAKAGIEIKFSRQIPFGHPQQQAQQLAIIAHGERLASLATEV